MPWSVSKKREDPLSSGWLFWEKNLSAIFDLVLPFGEKMDAKFSEASTNERERMKSLYKLLEIKMDEHSTVLARVRRKALTDRADERGRDVPTLNSPSTIVDHPRREAAGQINNYT